MSLTMPTRYEFQGIVDRLEKVNHEHTAWLLHWHRALVCPASAHVPSDDAHLQCEFGKWYHGQPPAYLAQFPIFKQIGLLHFNMHTIANRLLQHGVSDQHPFLEEYDAFLKARGAFLELVEILQTEMTGVLLHIHAITRVVDPRTMLARLYQCQERLETQKENSVLCLLKLDYPHKIYEYHVPSREEPVIADIAHFLVTHLRTGDIIFRSHADEFLLALVNLSLPTAHTVVERLRIAFHDRNSDLAKTFLQVATSFGIAPLESGVSVEDAIARARQALYVARAQCHKRVACWKPTMILQNDPTERPHNRCPL